MIFYGSFKAVSGLKKTPMIDYIEFEFPAVPEKFCPDDLDATDVALSCDWDESDWDYDKETGEGCFRCKGVYINQVYANGHIDLFKDAQAAEIQVYAPDNAAFELAKLEIVDGEECLTLKGRKIDPYCTIYTE